MKISDKQMALGELIRTLKRKDAEADVVFDFVHFRPSGSVHSYRGYYEDLAIGYGTDKQMTVRQLIDMLENASGKTFTGYKGGEFTMDDDTVVWVANHNESGGTAIVDVEGSDYQVVLRTEKID